MKLQKNGLLDMYTAHVADQISQFSLDHPSLKLLIKTTINKTR
jgi:hypothetical protein